MRTLLAIAFIALSTAAAFGQSGPAAGSYSGTWLLDASRSKGLPPHYSVIQAHRLNVKQTKSALSVDVELAFNNGEETFRTNFNYPLDGSENSAEIPIRTPKGPGTMPATLSGKQSADGKLNLTIVRELPPGSPTTNGTTHETWQLTDDGKSLVIHVSRDTPQGKVEYDMLFVRQ